MISIDCGLRTARLGLRNPPESAESSDTYLVGMRHRTDFADSSDATPHRLVSFFPRKRIFPTYGASRNTMSIAKVKKCFSLYSPSSGCDSGRRERHMSFDERAVEYDVAAKLNACASSTNENCGAIMLTFCKCCPLKSWIAPMITT